MASISRGLTIPCWPMYCIILWKGLAIAHVSIRHYLITSNDVLQHPSRNISRSLFRVEARATFRALATRVSGSCLATFFPGCAFWALAPQTFLQLFDLFFNFLLPVPGCEEHVVGISALFFPFSLHAVEAG